MANLLSIATGNLTAAATWGLCDATGSLVSSNTGVTTLTTGNLDSATFTPGAITVKGVALRLGSRASGSPTNTLTVTLRNSTDGLDVIAGTINVSDLPVTNTTDDQGGWFYLVFSAPQLLTAGKAYVVRVTLSATTTAVQLCTNGTANNWQRLLVTTTTQAPVAGDDLQVLGVLDGASNPATVSTITVTMNSTANTDYGSATTGSYRVAGLTISKGGTFAFGTAAATNYYFKLSGYVAVYSGGVLNVGTTGTPIPTGSMAVFELDPASDGQYKIEIRASGTVTAIGSPRTAGKAVSWTQLMADAAGGATSPRTPACRASAAGRLPSPTSGARARSDRSDTSGWCRTAGARPGRAPARPCA